MSNQIPLFVSYSHKDKSWCELFRLTLNANFDMWIDAHNIRAGDKWNDEINKGLLGAEAVLLLLSKHFMESQFIQREELPHILQRYKAERLRIIPVLIDDCPISGIQWLQDLQLLPRGGKSLASYGEPGSDTAEGIIAVVSNVIGTIFKIPEISGGPQRKLAWDMLSTVLLTSLDPASKEVKASQLLDDVAKRTGLRGIALFNAVRFFIEYQLLRFEEPTSPATLEQSLKEGSGDPNAIALLRKLKDGADKGGDYSQVEIDVDPMSLMKARDREYLWQKYFEFLGNSGQSSRDVNGTTSTLASINVQAGFISPQFLIAGLMSRFDEDWDPVLRAYSLSMQNAEENEHNFASLQASQWITWLIWGPSVPICRCKQWRGQYAFQFGYGDENNSLPLLEALPDSTEPKLGILGEFAKKNAQQGRSAAGIKLRGRLRWAPFVLRRSEGAVSKNSDVVEDSEAQDDGAHPHGATASERLALANAQAALHENALADPDQPNGLLLQFDKLMKPSDELREYFTAYLWMIFLVAKTPHDGDAGPQLLWDRTYPRLPENPSDRRRVRKQELWRNLLPVFVHANIADSTALGLQRRMLVQSSLTLLRQLWCSRAEYFDASDVKDGISFYLVSASDYSGCGEEIRFPSNKPLAELMRDQLALESDPRFAQAIVLPSADESGSKRPWGLASHFSSCHLPDMVADYYDYVEAQLNEAEREDKRHR